MLLKLLIRSLELDSRFLLISRLGLREKVEFILGKYIVLFRNFTFGIKLGESRAKVFNKDYYFDDKFGISFLQSLYVDSSFLSRYVKAGAVVIDVGANIGQFNFFCKQYLRAKKVYSLEPVKRSFAILAKNSPKLVYNVAAETSPKIALFVPECSGMASRYNTFDQSYKEWVTGCNLGKIKEIQKEKKFDLLKVDTEGSELNSLKSCGPLLQKVKYILVEASINRASGGGLLEIIDYLQSKRAGLKILHVGRPYLGEGGEVQAIDVLFGY